MIFEVRSLAKGGTGFDSFDKKGFPEGRVWDTYVALEDDLFYRGDLWKEKGSGCLVRDKHLETNGAYIFEGCLVENSYMMGEKATVHRVQIAGQSCDVATAFSDIFWRVTKEGLVYRVDISVAYPNEDLDLRSFDSITALEKKLRLKEVA